MKIDTITLSHLRNEEYFTMMTNIADVAKRTGVNTGHLISPVVTPFENQLKNLDKALEVIRKSTLTDALHELDVKRDNLFRALRSAVDAELLTGDPARLPAAQRVDTVLKHYKKILTMSDADETGAITNMVQELNGGISGPDCSLLGLVPRINALAAANRDFNTAFEQRGTEAASKDGPKVPAERKKTNECYRKLMAAAEGMWQETDTKLTAFINEANAIIRRYSDNLAVRAGIRAANKENASGDVPPVTIVTGNTGPA